MESLGHGLIFGFRRVITVIDTREEHLLSGMLIAGRYTIIVRGIILMKDGEERFLGTRCSFTRVAKSVLQNRERGQRTCIL